MIRQIEQFIRRLVLVLAILSVTSISSVAQDRTEEYQLKAVLLSRLMSFITWPENVEGPSKFCVIGQNPFGSELEAVFADSQIEIEQLGNQYSFINECNAIFISDSEIRNFESVLDLVAEQPILTISDVPRFAISGGMINLTFENRRVRFRINKDEADAVDLKLSFQLLDLADIVQTRITRRQ